MMKKILPILIVLFCLVGGGFALSGEIMQMLSAKSKPSELSLLSLSSFLKESHEKKASFKYVRRVLSETKALQEAGFPAEAYVLKATEALAKGVDTHKSFPGALKKTKYDIQLASRLSNQLLGHHPPQERWNLKPQLYQKLYSSLRQGLAPIQLQRLADKFSAQGKPWTWVQLSDALVRIKKSKPSALVPRADRLKKYKKHKKYKRQGPPAHAPAHGYRRKR